jgi:hypothetical protein
MTLPPTPPLCDSCSRRTALSKCTAYPTGIPVQILANLVDHRQPYEGDHGKQFMEDKDNNKNLGFTLQVLEGG